MKSGLRILIGAPKLPFSVPSKWQINFIGAFTVEIFSENLAEKKITDKRGIGDNAFACRLA